MKVRMILKAGLMIAFMIPFAGEAQTKKKEKTGKVQSQAVKTPASKSTPAAVFTNKQHVYFPDYYAFYDPNRGYVFWNIATNSWTTSRQVPEFMSNVDMSKTRIQILEGLSLDLHPETNYPNYMKLYPAQTDNPDVPVPNARQTSR